jgi:tetratricopeptide (TPR) repeat protein
MRAIAWHEWKGDLDKALKDFADAVRLDPSDAAAYGNRGVTWTAKGEFDKALDDFDKALRLDPKYASAFNNRGVVWQMRKEYGKALADFDETIRVEQKYESAYNNRAWVRATCPDVKIRDGKKALEDAKKCCELTGFKSPEALDTLAAAHAEAGDFDEAVKSVKKALDLPYHLPQAQADRYRARLKLYEQRKPYRDE